MLVLSFVCSGLEFGSVNHTSIYENSESNFSGEIPNNWPNDLLGTSIHKSLEFWQYYNGLILLQ